MENINNNNEEIHNEEYEWTETEKRKHMLENLLILLNSAAVLGLGPKQRDFNSNGYQRPKTSEYPNSKKENWER